MTAGVRRQAGATLFELVVSLIIIVVLSGLLLQRLAVYQREAEMANAERLVAVLRSALLLRSSQLSMAGKHAELAALVRDNPMNWLVKPPPNYVGEYFSPDARQIAPGNWYYDRRSKELKYVPARSRLPVLEEEMFLPPLPVLRYRVVQGTQAPELLDLN